MRSEFPPHVSGFIDKSRIFFLGKQIMLKLLGFYLKQVVFVFICFFVPVSTSGLLGNSLGTHALSFSI